MASGAALAGIVANVLGVGQSLTVATAETVAFWAQAGFIPVMLAGVFLAFRLAALPARQTDDRRSAAGEQGAALGPAPEAPNDIDAGCERRSRAADTAGAGLERVGED